MCNILKEMINTRSEYYFLETMINNEDVEGMFVADFETITDPNDCRVWAYATCEIGNEDNITYGNSIEDFFKWCKTKGSNTITYFHNLKFDGSFILDYLLNNGYKHITDKKKREEQTFTTMISEGMFYDITVYFKKRGKRFTQITFRDSLKLLPMSVDSIAKAFNLSISKLELDYNAYRSKNHILTEDEVNYITNDVKIVAKAIEFLTDKGMTKMTTASNALNDYKNTIGKNRFPYIFPVPEKDKDIRQSYKGGFTYLNPKYREKEVKEGIVFDVNSLYPSVMYNEVLPYGKGVWYEGKYEYNEDYPLYIQMISCSFKLKENHIPTIQIKKGGRFIPTEYICSTDGEIVTLCLTSVDLELFLEHYEPSLLVYHSGWMFQGKAGRFKEYIDKWSAEKIKAKNEGNGGMYTLSKLMLNSLYGKFGAKTEGINQIPYLNEDGVLAFRLGEVEERKPVYIPMASFITAYARNKTIRSAQAVYDRFIYADTDSLHLEGLEIPKELEVHDTKLGAWKHESSFSRAKFIRAKTYVEDSNPPEVWNDPDKYDKKLFKITCAGMPSKCYENVTYDNFRSGAVYAGKLQSARVKGGAVLKETTFEIKI